MEEITLLPKPRQMHWQDGRLNLDGNKLIALEGGLENLFTAQRLQTDVRQHTGLEWAIVAGTAVPHEQLGMLLSVTPGSVSHPQGYQLTVTETAVHIVASTGAGLFYGVCTLVQLLSVYSRELPLGRISDWPDLPHRGIMLDISRNRVPTMDTLYDLIDMLAGWKINQIQLYTEHTFAYRNHPVVWQKASPMTGEEILALDAFCRARFIELVPNQNSFGHMHHWLRHEAYAHLAEAPEGAQTPWGFFRPGPFGLSPAVPETADFVRSLFDELLPHFTSRQLNIGGDETYDLGQGKSKALVEERGVGRVYLDFLLKLYREVKARGRTMQFWGDIIVQYPDLVAELPRDVIALEWGYEADHPFNTNGALFARSGIPFYVCPGTSSWNTLAGRTENMLGNVRNAVESGLKHGAIGCLLTDWGDRGHWQALPVSYLGFGYGAAVSWGFAANADTDVAATVSRYAFGDKTGAMGRLAYDLGNAYRETGAKIHNTSLLFALLQAPADGLDKVRNSLLAGEITAEGFTRSLAFVDEVRRGLDTVVLQREDADLIKREFRWTADMLRHAVHRARWMLDGASQPAPNLAAEADGLIAEFHALWHARSRPGEYSDSAALLAKMRASYGD
jgi:hypothetical protein